MRDPLDRYYTPEVLAHNLTKLLPLKFKKVIESSVGGGAFARAALLQSPKELIGVDIDPNASGKLNCHTFIEGDWLEVSKNISCDWVVGNPPFNDAEAHVRASLGCAEIGVAMLLRLAFLESVKRIDFWTENRPNMVYVLSKRPSFTGGATDSCAYGFFVWTKDNSFSPAINILDTEGKPIW